MPDTAATWSHHATFEATPISASHARAFVSGHLVEHRLLYLVDPVRLVASELATNAVVHASTAFRVTLAGLGETVLLTVRDESRSTLSRRPAHAMDESGRGLEIVNIVSLAWGINEDAAGSKAVWASFAMRAPRSSGPFDVKA
ncbi:MAG TPA: ATP-binding protein [Nocardioides sp.]|nr:ATP-binding protein [Nocardioides sp.]